MDANRREKGEKKVTCKTRELAVKVLARDIMAT